MPDKTPKKKPEIPQPRPDIVLPDDAADPGARELQRAPSPRSEPGQEGA